MNEDIFKKQPGYNKEKLQVKVELATPENWKECKRLRLLELTGEDAEMFGAGPKHPEKLEEEQKRGEKEWREDLSPENKDVFFVLSWKGPNAVGLGRASQRGEGVWRMAWGYTEKSFRKQGFGTKNFALRLKNIIERGGKKVTIGVKANNKDSISLAKSFDFKTDDTIPIKLQKMFKYSGYNMELDLSNPEVIKKINEVLNAG